MSFVIQLIGQAAGGTVHLGPHHALQAFACEGDCLGQKGSTEVFLRDAALREGEVPVPSPFPGKVADAQTIRFEEKDDDARLVDDPYLDDQEAWDAAQYEKIGGSVVFGNEPWAAECAHCGEAMPLWGNFYAMEAECFFRACPHMHEIIMITQP